MGIGKTTRIRSIAEAHHAVFAAILVAPTQTTASNMGRGQISAIASTDARKAARPVPPATMSTLAILLLTASGQAPAKHSTREPKPVPFVRQAAMNTPIM